MEKRGKETRIFSIDKTRQGVKAGLLTLALLYLPGCNVSLQESATSSQPEVGDLRILPLNHDGDSCVTEEYTNPSGGSGKIYQKWTDPHWVSGLIPEGQACEVPLNSEFSSCVYRVYPETQCPQ